MLIEGFVLLGYAYVIVVTAYVLDAVQLQLVDVLRAAEQAVCYLVIDILFGRLNVDDGSQIVLVQQFILLFLAATNYDEPLGHRQECIHAWRVAIELVQQDMTAIHHFLILGKGDVLGLDNGHTIGAEIVLQTLEGRLHDVGAFVGRAGTLYAQKEMECSGGRGLERSNGSDRGKVDGEGYEAK